jgi:DNA-binding Lrp family transcriptional regulator
MVLDKLDLAILKRLLEDGRLAYVKLAKELKVPDTTIHFRLKRLQELGVLKGFTAVIDPRQTGLKDLAIIKLKIEPHPVEFLTEERLEEIAAEFGKLDQVKFLATSVEAGELIAIVGADDRRVVNKIAARMKASGGIKEVELIRLSEVLKGYLPIASI